ncbi:MAG TPA: DUF6602 domain-containing protein [Terracidiphilus sp.]
MSEFELLDQLHNAGTRMEEDLKERLTSHPGELGRNREEVIRQFLRHYLPRRFEISHGFAFDSAGGISKELDVIVADAQCSPRFETAGGVRYFPCESIVAVGQVRSSLAGREQLRDVLSNLESAKSLDRSAAARAIDSVSREPLTPLTNHLDQIFSFVFVIGNMLKAETMRDEILDHVLHRSPHLWPNIIFGCDKYLLTFCCDAGICPNPMDAKGIAVQMAYPDQDILMKFYLLLGRAVDATRVSHFPYWEYLNRITKWSAEVFYSSSEHPPPHLSSLFVG